MMQESIKPEYLAVMAALFYLGRLFLEREARDLQTMFASLYGNCVNTSNTVAV